ncbi:hypothetical protein SEUCBS140593_006383 [Sporothrix eucalyptigena]|uniref:Vacuolar protein sorting-associated protein VTA1 n=1 Tax=Sporothrix eucalyptigena TaxID=1812306 RepID=A0ABP0C4N2_9PEZI
MADAPASLRAADANIYKTAMRAEQLQSVKPIIAYWCDYWVLKQILAKGLHNTNPEILEYSSRLMDKMEQTKATHGTEDAINDDISGQLYVEQFAQETLDRAQRVVKANKVTATTANTFDAAATFFGLVNVWGAPDAETLQKIKYAKWNAARILKAIKEGNDPNESNPNPDDLPPQDQELLGAKDKDAEAVSPGTEIPPAPPSSAPRPVTIEDDLDDTASNTRRDSAGVSLPHSPALSANGQTTHVAPSFPTTASSLPQAGATPLSFTPPAPASADPDRVPGYPPPQSLSPTLPTFNPPTAPPADSFYQQPPSAPPQQPFANSYFAGTTAPPPPASTASASSASGYPFAYNNRVVPQASAPAAQAPYVQPATVDDLAMVNAQKHAKWAISALNFEDTATAVRELRKALEFLGAS